MSLLLDAMLGFTLLLAGSALLLMRLAQRDAQISRRLRQLRDGGAVVAAPGPSAAGAALQVVSAMGAGLARSGLLPAATLDELRQTLVAAGLRDGSQLGVFIGAKLLLLVALPLLAWLIVGRTGLAFNIRWMIVALAGLAGMLAPDMVIRHLHARHRARVERGLPDALDLMVICAQAGLGLEAAIDRVATEIEDAHPSVAQELAATAAELRVGSDRRGALTAMGARAGLDSMRRLGATLIQTLQFGTPLTLALRVLAAELRTEMLTNFEERAARLPVLLTMPMIIFILPCVFIVVGGPAALQIMTLFKH